MKVARKRFVNSAIENWTTLNEALSQMDEDDVIYATKLERSRAKPRGSFIRRLNQRFVGIRAEKVRRELSDEKTTGSSRR